MTTTDSRIAQSIPGAVGDAPGTSARPGLPGVGPRRQAVLIAGLGLCTVIPFYAWLAGLQAQDRSAAALGMADMHMNQMSVYWAFPLLQATGIAALLWAYLGVTLGLTESGRTVSRLPLSRRQLDGLHRQVSLLVIALILAHALATACDAMGDNPVTVFVPNQEGWSAAKWAYDLGIIALYLALLLGPTYYLRRRIGARTWRFAHRFTLLVYILSVWHTLIIGADVEHYGWVRPIIWLAQLPLLGLFARRLLQPSGRHSSRAWATAIRYGLAVTCAVAMAAIVLIVATGTYPTVVQSIQ